mmetsp:Transcript_20780/g.54280  ORF Transcript_20780/g.54280 Transcript_20780/m.54280 type:complete len:345 (-) Transcript_20780:54-1088(-)
MSSGERRRASVPRSAAPSCRGDFIASCSAWAAKVFVACCRAAACAAASSSRKLPPPLSAAATCCSIRLRVPGVRGSTSRGGLGMADVRLLTGSEADSKGASQADAADTCTANVAVSPSERRFGGSSASSESSSVTCLVSDAAFRLSISRRNPWFSSTNRSLSRCRRCDASSSSASALCACSDSTRRPSICLIASFSWLSSIARQASHRSLYCSRRVCSTAPAPPRWRSFSSCTTPSMPSASKSFRVSIITARRASGSFVTLHVSWVRRMTSLTSAVSRLFQPSSCPARRPSRRRFDLSLTSASYTAAADCSSAASAPTAAPPVATPAPMRPVHVMICAEGTFRL